MFSSLLSEVENKLIIDAAKFEADDKKGITIFTGNVRMTRIKDKINCDILEVYMIIDQKTNKRTPKKYIAIGHVEFEVYSKNKIYIGSGDKVIFDPIKMKYTVIGNGYLEEKTEGKKLFGDKIYLDEKSGEANVEGSKDQPVRFIMTIKPKEETSK